MYHFLERKEHVREAVEQVKEVDIYLKTMQQELIELTNLSTKHDDDLGMIFNIFDTFQSSLQKYIQTVTERIDMIEASNVGGTAVATGLRE